MVAVTLEGLKDKEGFIANCLRVVSFFLPLAYNV